MLSNDEVTSKQFLSLWPEELGQIAYDETNGGETLSTETFDS